jgi:hypothetical protein
MSTVLIAECQGVLNPAEKHLWAIESLGCYLSFEITQRGVKLHHEIAFQSLLTRISVKFILQAECLSLPLDFACASHGTVVITMRLTILSVQCFVPVKLNTLYTVLTWRDVAHMVVQWKACNGGDRFASVVTRNFRCIYSRKIFQIPYCFSL